MKLEDALNFKGTAEDFEQYCKLLKKAERLKKEITRLSNKIDDEDASLSVFEGELTERDKELFNRHVATRKDLYTKRYKKQGEFELTMKKIFEYRPITINKNEYKTEWGK